MKAKTGKDETRSGRSEGDIALVLVAAVADNGVIGRRGQLPWRIKSEMAHFRAVTMGKPVVMGRKTYLSIGKPLNGRTNIVISRDLTFAAAGVLVAPNVETALAAARADALRRSVSEISVIGGAEIYVQTMAAADRLVISLVHLQPDGDTTFPPIDSGVWQETNRTLHDAGPGDDASYTVLTYDRRAPG